MALLGTITLLTGCSGSGAIVPATTTTGETARAAASSTLTESWSTFPPGVDWLDGTTDGQWVDQWAGYGTIDVVEGSESDDLELSPKAATNGDHSALVTSLASYADFTLSVPVTTRAQLSAAPNPWEVGWVLWHYQDNTHFYAFTPQPNGWELSKEDPAYPGDQRFLLTGSTPTFPIGVPYAISVQQTGAAMTVSVNGTVICTFTDTERPYESGSVGLYAEEATVDFGPLAIDRNATP